MDTHRSTQEHTGAGCRDREGGQSHSIFTLLFQLLEGALGHLLPRDWVHHHVAARGVGRPFAAPSTCIALFRLRHGRCARVCVCVYPCVCWSFSLTLLCVSVTVTVRQILARLFLALGGHERLFFSENGILKKNKHPPPRYLPFALVFFFFCGGGSSLSLCECPMWGGRAFLTASFGRGGLMYSVSECFTVCN